PTPTPALYTLSLHDALPILPSAEHDDVPFGEGIRLPEWDYRKQALVEDYVLLQPMLPRDAEPKGLPLHLAPLARRLRRQFEHLRNDRQWLRQQPQDRKSTRLNSSHVKISYAVFCLKKKKNTSTGHSHNRATTRQAWMGTCRPRSKRSDGRGYMRATTAMPSTTTWLNRPSA